MALVIWKLVVDFFGVLAGIRSDDVPFDGFLEGAFCGGHLEARIDFKGIDGLIFGYGVGWGYGGGESEGDRGEE